MTLLSVSLVIDEDAIRTGVVSGVSPHLSTDEVTLNVEGFAGAILVLKTLHTDFKSDILLASEILHDEGGQFWRRTIRVAESRQEIVLVGTLNDVTVRVD